MIAMGLRFEVVPKREGNKGIGSTVRGDFGKLKVDGRPYYCQPGLWPERCADGKTFGPPVPDGHRDRIACEQHATQLLCSFLTLEGDGGSHMSLDPWSSIGGVNQNHPRNVRRGCGEQFSDHESWRKEPHEGKLYIVEGQIDLATAHGKGKVCASAKDGIGRTCIRIDQ